MRKTVTSMYLSLNRVAEICKGGASLYRKRSHPEFHSLVREHIERLGPSFIKLGQSLSMRPDFLPEPLCEELEKCLDQMPPMDTDVIHAVIREELGAPPHAIFKRFSRKPVATASMAQVHKATLKDGTKVAVKILRPGIEQMIRTDLFLMKMLAKLRFLSKTLRRMNITDIVEEYERFTMDEINLRKEAEYTELVGAKADEAASCPNVHRDYCTDKILVTDWMDGTPLSRLIQMRRKGTLDAWLEERDLDLEDIVVNLMETGLGQALIHGFFHGDLHSSNVLVGDDGSIQWIDFGICGYLDDRLRRNYFYFIVALAANDAKGCTHFLKKCCEPWHVREDFDEHLLRAQISKMIDEQRGKSTREFSQGKITMRIIQASMAAGLDVPRPLILLSRCSLALDGIAQKLYPEWTWGDHAANLFNKVFNAYMQENISPHKMYYETDAFMQQITQLSQVMEKVTANAGRSLREDDEE